VGGGDRTGVKGNEVPADHSAAVDINRGDVACRAVGCRGNDTAAAGFLCGHQVISVALQYGLPDDIDVSVDDRAVADFDVSDRGVGGDIAADVGIVGDDAGDVPAVRV